MSIFSYGDESFLFEKSAERGLTAYRGNDGWTPTAPHVLKWREASPYRLDTRTLEETKMENTCPLEKQTFRRLRPLQSRNRQLPCCSLIRFWLLAAVLAIAVPGFAQSNPFSTVDYDASPATPSANVGSACFQRSIGGNTASYQYVARSGGGTVKLRFIYYFDASCSGSSTTVFTYQGDKVDVGQDCFSNSGTANTVVADAYYCFENIASFWVKLDSSGNIEVYRHKFLTHYDPGDDFETGPPGPGEVQGGIVSAIPLSIEEGHVGAGTVSLTIAFFEDMDTAVDPAISFPDPDTDPSPTLTLAGGSWLDSKTYVATYDVVDADQAISRIGVEVSGARYPSGSTQGTWPFSSVFSVQMPSPDLSVSKTVSVTTPAVGDEVSFSISAANAGPDDSATGIEISDLLPAGFTHIGDDSGGSYDSSSGTWTVGSLEPGDSQTLNVTARVSPSASSARGSGDFLGVFADGLAPSTLSTPKAITFGPDSNLYVTSQGTGEVLRFDGTTGDFIDTFVTAGLNLPGALVFSPSGDLYVTFHGSEVDGIKLFDGTSGVFVEKILTPRYSELELSRDMSFDSDGELFVASSSNDMALKYDLAAHTFQILVDSDPNLDEPHGIVFTPAGDLLVSSGATGQIMRYDPASGASLGVFADLGVGASPASMIYGPDGNLFVADSIANSIERFDGSTGTWMETFVAAGSGGLSSPGGLAFGPLGNLYVASTATDQVLRYDGFLVNTASVTALDQADFDQRNDKGVAGIAYQNVDFGDAPDPVVSNDGSYPTLAANLGARHLATGPLLGSLRTTEFEGQPSALADSDDDDGITFTSPIERASNAAVDVVASADAVLDAWVDFDSNGVWEFDEKVFGGTALSAGLNSLVFAVPADAVVGPSFARFRISSAGIGLPTGLAIDGEVEDYPVPLETPVELVSFSVE